MAPKALNVGSFFFRGPKKIAACNRAGEDDLSPSDGKMGKKPGAQRECVPGFFTESALSPDYALWLLTRRERREIFLAAVFL